MATMMPIKGACCEPALRADMPPTSVNLRVHGADKVTAISAAGSNGKSPCAEETLIQRQHAPIVSVLLIGSYPSQIISRKGVDATSRCLALSRSCHSRTSSDDPHRV